MRADSLQLFIALVSVAALVACKPVARPPGATPADPAPPDEAHWSCKYVAEAGTAAKMLHGLDHRVPVGSVTEPGIRENADRTVIIVGARHLEGPDREGMYRIRPDFLANHGERVVAAYSLETGRLCDGEPYRGELFLDARFAGLPPCSGVALDEGLVATAAHCVPLRPVSKREERFVGSDRDSVEKDARGTGRGGSDAATTETAQSWFRNARIVAGVRDLRDRIPRAQVGRPLEIQYYERHRGPTAHDVAVVRVMRLEDDGDPDPGKTFLPDIDTVSFEPAPTPRTPVYMLGHPFALRLMFAGCADIGRFADGAGATTLDAVPGNSGSPIFSAETNALLGIHNRFRSRNAKDGFDCTASDTNGSCCVLRRGPDDEPTSVFTGIGPMRHTSP